MREMHAISRNFGGRSHRPQFHSESLRRPLAVRWFRAARSVGLTGRSPFLSPFRLDFPAWCWVTKPVSGQTLQVGLSKPNLFTDVN